MISQEDIDNKYKNYKKKEVRSSLTIDSNDGRYAYFYTFILSG